MRFVPWLVVVGALAGACILPSEDDFTRAYVPPDAGHDSGATATEGGVNAAEGGSPNDAGTDAPAGFCPRTAVYCNDFSGGSPSDLGAIEVSAGCDLRIVNGTLEAKLPAFPDQGYFFAGAGHDLPAASSKATVEVDLNVSAATWDGGNMVVLGFYHAGDPNNQAEELYIDGEQSSVTTSENSALVYDYAKKELPRGRWVHVKFEADFTAHQGSFRVSYDGVLAITHDGVLDFTPANGDFKVIIGMTRNNAPTPALTVAYDNLVISLP